VTAFTELPQMDELRIEYEKNQSGMGTIAFGVVGLVRGASAPSPLPHNSAQALPPIPLHILSSVTV
jgi:hypothetical protein